MRAVRVVSHRLSLSFVIALLALCGSTPAWSEIITEFANSWSGPASTPNLVSGLFTSTVPADLVLRTAEMTVDTHGMPSGATWVGPGGEIHLEFTNVAATQMNAFAKLFTGVIHVTGGTGQFEHSTIQGGTFNSFFMFSAPNGPLASASTFSSGNITFIPEPAVWLMLAGGLGLLGFMRIRRAVHTL